MERVRRLAGTTLLYFLLAVGSAGAQTGDPIDVIRVPANGFGRGEVTLKAGAPYTMVVSGTRQEKDRDHVLQEDAFYCFQSNTNQCNPPIEWTSIQVKTGPQESIAALGQYVDGRKPPPLSASHEYAVKFHPKASGTLFASASSCAGEGRSCSGPGFTIKIYGEPEETCAGDACVTISNPDRKVEVQRNESGWEPATAGMKLTKGDRIHTGFKASVAIAFADGSTGRIGQMALAQIDDISGSAAELKVRLTLKTGEVKLQVNRSTGARGDFQVKTPTTTASVRGTVFSVAFNGASTLVSVTESSVDVTANNGTTVTVPAGSQTESTATTVAQPVPIGAGPKRGGLTAGAALAKLSGKVARGLAKCKYEVISNAIAPAPGGWSGRFVIVGAKQDADDKPKGTARFRLKGKKVLGSNTLAKQILKGCR